MGNDTMMNEARKYIDYGPFELNVVLERAAEGERRMEANKSEISKAKRERERKRNRKPKVKTGCKTCSMLNVCIQTRAF